MPADARHAALITARFSDLLGLRQAVGGAGLLLLFAWEMAFPLTLADLRAAGGPQLLSYVLLVLGCAALIAGVLWVNAWYRRHYGEVVRTRAQKRLGVVVAAAGVLAFLVPFEVDAFAQNSGHIPPVNLALFTLALWIIGYWLYLGRPFWHYLLISGVGFIFGIATITGMLSSTFDWHVRETTLYLGLATLVGGVIDHRILTTSLPRPETSVAIDS